MQERKRLIADRRVALRFFLFPFSFFLFPFFFFFLCSFLSSFLSIIIADNRFIVLTFSSFAQQVQDFPALERSASRKRRRQ